MPQPLHFGASTTASSTAASGRLIDALDQGTAAPHLRSKHEDERTMAASRHPGSRFTEALAFASRVHADQRRKGTDIPYVAHLLSVAALVLEHGGDEDVAIAALLHDAAEDQGGRAMLGQIREAFGERVAELVDACTDAYVQPKPPWRRRKEEYLAHLRQASEDARLISLADKLHNAISIVEDHRQVGAKLWDRFSPCSDQDPDCDPVEEILWYYTGIVAATEGTVHERLRARLERCVSEMQERVARVRSS